MKRLAYGGFVAAAGAGMVVLSLVSFASAASVQRLSADYQNLASTKSDEISTTAAPLANGKGGIAVYRKTLNIPPGVIFVTFAGQGDSHNGSATLLSANLQDGSGTTVCPALAGCHRPDHRAGPRS